MIDFDRLRAFIVGFAAGVTSSYALIWWATYWFRG